MTKINQILSDWIPGDVHTLRWFAKKGVGQRTAHQYYESSSLEKIGSGVFSRKGDKLHWAGAVRSMQEELGLKLHVGGFSALSLQGVGHQVSFDRRIELVTNSKLNLPKWVVDNEWSKKLELRRSSLSSYLPLTSNSIDGITVSIASRELAILEYASKLDLSHSFESLENQLVGLRTLRSEVLQQLLESCSSIKTKRVFLYLSESLDLPYFKKLNLSQVDLGSGKRVIVKGGVLNQKYKITVPRDPEDNPF